MSSTTAVDTGSSALEILIHPLVIMSIADHYTRNIYQPMNQSNQQSSNPPRVFGLLFGSQDGRTVHVSETVEAAYHWPSQSNNQSNSQSNSQPMDDSLDVETPIFEWDALANDVKLFQASYPSYECLGWYSATTNQSNNQSITQSIPGDLQIHQSMSQFNERPLYLLLDASTNQSNNQSTNQSTNQSSQRRDLPLMLFEESHHILNSTTSSDLCPTRFTISADESERVISFHCSNLVQKREHDSELTPHYQQLYKAVQSLHSRLTSINSLLQATKRGDIAHNHALLREIKGLFNRLPIGADPSVSSAFREETNETNMLTQLSLLTRAMEQMRDVSEKFQVLKSGQKKEHGMNERRKGGGAVMSMLGLDD
jgi:hypothetical protein